MIVADTSLSTRCGVDGVSIATVIARAVATLSLAGAFCQDQVGLVTLDGPKRRMSVRPRVGRNHAIHCIEAYQTEVLADDGETETSTVANPTLTGMLRRRSLIPVVSDFLFEDVESLLDELAELSAVHDVFLAMIDCVFAFELPGMAAEGERGTRMAGENRNPLGDMGVAFGLSIVFKVPMPATRGDGSGRGESFCTLGERPSAPRRVPSGSPAVG